MVWLWPQNNNNITFNDNSYIEDFFKAIYAPYDVVYVSRGRVATSLILEIEEASRPNLTYTQPYSSCCVLSSISEFTTPNTVSPEICDRQIIYHQFGHKTKVNSSIYKKVLIEDSVDSLIIINDGNEIFPNNGEYCIISLSKTLHLPYGAIVICQDKEKAEELRKIRDLNEILIPPHYHELVENDLYFGSILRNNPGVTPVKNASEIEILYKEATSKISNNIEQLSKILPELNINMNNYKNRLPSNLYYENLSDCLKEKIAKIIDIEVPIRNYYNYNTLTAQQVSLIPVHIDAIFQKKERIWK